MKGELTILPPYVEPEHRPLIDKAEESLKEYEGYLLSSIKKELFDDGWNLNPDPQAIMKAERQYHEDSTRQLLIKSLSEIRMITEKPRFLIKKYAEDED